MVSTPTAAISLASLDVGQRAIITAVGQNKAGISGGAVERRLLEIGFEEGREVEVRHLGPVGRDPIAVRVESSLIGICRRDAQYVLVVPIATTAEAEKNGA